MRTYIDYRLIRSHINSKINRDVVVELLRGVEIDIGRNYRFVENDSFSIDKNGRIKDFGSTGFSGDFISFMVDILGYSPNVSIEWTAKALGVWHE